MFDGIPPSSISEQRLTLPDGKTMRFLEITPQEPRADCLVVLGKGGYAEKFPPLARWLFSRNLHAFIPELPNQGLSDRFIPSGRKKHNRNHVPNFERLVEAIDFFCDTVIERRADKRRLLGLGHSEGGHLVAREAAEHPERNFAAIILGAPMFDFTVRSPVTKERIHRPWYGTFITGAFVLTGFSTTYAPGEDDYNPTKIGFEENLNTSNEAHFNNNRERLAADPRKAIGGVTMGRYRAMEKSIKRTQRKGYFDRMPPSLVIAGEEDKVIPPELIELYVGRMPESTTRYEILRRAKHDIFGEPLPIRREIWRMADEFLNEHVFH